MARFNANISLIFLIATSRAFHCRSPPTEKALFANFVLVAGVRRPEPAAAESVKILVVVSAM